MCREELNFHMRSFNISRKEKPKIAEFRLKSSSPSNSPTRDVRARSSFKQTRHEQNQMIDDTADMLATMVKTRRANLDANILTQQSLSTYNSRNTNSSPHTLEETTTDLRTLTLKPQRRAFEDTLSKAMNIMHRAKPITKGFLCEYKISVFTGNCNGASTNAPILIKLYGTNGHTNFYDLTQSQTHHIPFLKGQTDVFTLQTYDVGNLVGIMIGHDRKDMRASWFLNKVTIEDPIRNLIYDIPCNAWLSIKSHDQRTIRTFPVLSTIPSKQKKQRDLNETHSDYSTTITERTTRSITTNPSENDALTEKKSRKSQQHVSIGPTTIENLLNPNEFLPTARPIRSPVLSTTSSDSELIAKPLPTNLTSSPTSNPTRLPSLSENELLQTTTTNESFQRNSFDYGRPPARLENRISPFSFSPERTNQQDDDADNILKFFQ